MTDLLYARWLMGSSLAFHIMFAAIGVALPLLMTLAEWRWLRTGDTTYRDLAQKWAKGTAILFAVGAVSGTVISFELGLLWPRFMAFAGAIIGLPFSLEGFAFFTEAIFLGIYLYGWERVGRRLHLAAGAIVAVSGAVSACFITLTNAWMNNPTGFSLVAGQASDVDPVTAMFAPGFAEEVVHVLLSCYAATGFAVAGIHAFYLWRNPTRAFHRAALTIALGVGGTAACLQPFSGDFSARHVAASQPLKLAALEGQFHTQADAPLRLGGLPDVDTLSTPYALEIPHGLSLLAFHDPHAKVRGLDAFARERWPNPLLVHLAFQVMVGAGSLLALVALLSLVALFRAQRRPRTQFVSRHLLAVIVACGPLGFITLEAGWLVTEWGRQPYTIMNTMLTSAAVTPVPHLAVPFWTFTALYVFLAVMVVVLLGRQIRHSSGGEPGEAAAPGTRAVKGAA